MDNDTSLGCCSHDPGDADLIGSISFWVEGVFTFVVGLFGLFGNLLSISVLLAKDMRNAFNYLLVALASVDSFLITFAILDHSIIRAFKMDA